MYHRLVTAVALVSFSACLLVLADSREAGAVTEGNKQSVSPADADSANAPVIPATSLTFRQAKIVRDGPRIEITPQVVRKYASMVPAQVKIPKANEDEVASLSEFLEFRVERQKQGKAGIYLGVVVADEPYTPNQPGYTGRDHFRSVRDRIIELVRGTTGDASNSGGYAKIYGAEVQAIIPLRYFEGAQQINSDGSRVDIRVNDIIMIVNDHVIPAELEEPHYFPNTLEEMEEWLVHLLRRDYHLYSFDEYRNNFDAIRTRAESKYQ